MTEIDQTALQRTLDEEQAEEMLDDLENIENTVPEGADLDDIQGWKLTFTFQREDIPVLKDEVREIVDDGE
jgi:hypothetical protein